MATTDPAATTEIYTLSLHDALPISTTDVPDYGVVGGNPARLLKRRFDDRTVERLLAVAWWDWPVEHVTAHQRTIMAGTVDELEAAGRELVDGA